MKKLLKAGAVAMAVVCLCTFFAGCHGEENPSAASSAAQNASWENGGKLPSAYSWEEYEALSDTQQELFFAWFGSVGDFEQWRTDAQISSVHAQLPWNQGGKLPSDYTWKEYEALNVEQQTMFLEWFENVEEFEGWMHEARQQEILASLPWENGGKKPSEYTWSEYEALNAAQQAQFFAWFALVEDYEAWMNEAQKQDAQADIPWENGGKKPSEYTWSEYEALTSAHRGAFMEWFGSTKAFEEWMDGAQRAEVSGELPWENGGKKPSEYTWKEFSALNGEQQELFSEWFPSTGAFESWMEEAKRRDHNAGIPWNNGGKQPDAYTWEEFEALNLELQEEFFAWFATAEEFEKWMNDAKS